MIKATRITDKFGRKGYFITNEDWRVLQKILVKKRKAKKSLMPGMIKAVEEIRAHLLGRISLPDASDPIPGFKVKKTN